MPPDYAQSSACAPGSMETRAQALRKPVIPAKAGIQAPFIEMDSRFRGNDVISARRTFTLAVIPAKACPRGSGDGDPLRSANPETRVTSMRRSPCRCLRLSGLPVAAASAPAHVGIHRTSMNAADILCLCPGNQRRVRSRASGRGGARVPVRCTLPLLPGGHRARGFPPALPMRNPLRVAEPGRIAPGRPGRAIPGEPRPHAGRRSRIRGARRATAEPAAAGRRERASRTRNPNA